MFLGTHTPRLDDKGRLILPAKFRDELAGGVVITKGQERCLYVFPVAEFARGLGAVLGREFPPVEEVVIGLRSRYDAEELRTRLPSLEEG